MAGRLQIRLRRGSYVPEFAFPPTPPTPSNSIDEETPTPREAQLSQPQDAPKNPRWWIVAAVVGVTAIAVAGTLNFFQGAAFDSLSNGRASPYSQNIGPRLLPLRSRI